MKSKKVSPFLFLVVMGITVTAFARTERYHGRSGEQCSSLCPKAANRARAICEDQGKSMSQHECQCNERANPPYAEIDFACK